MKLYGYLKGNGKLGNIVVSQVGGETIARDYQPNVSNPNTQLQVNQRGRFKLMAQIAAALAPVIAIPKKGLMSGRNQFVSRNIGQVYANDNVTSVSVENLQLTAGSSGLPAVVASRTAAAGSVSVKLASSAAMACSRVVYCMFVKTSYERLQYVTSIVADDVDGDGLFSAQLPAVGADAVIYAYGIKDLNAAASAAYGNYGVQNGEDVARLILSRSLSMSDYSFTQTRGTTLYGGELDNDAPGEGETKIYVTVCGNGSATGGGIISYGETAKLQATPAEGSTFVGWFVNGSNRFVSQNPTLMFKAEQISDYVAIFSNPSNPYLAPNGQPLVNGLPLNNVKLVSDEGEEVFVTSGLAVFENEIGAELDIVGAPAGQVIEYLVAGQIVPAQFVEETGIYTIDSSDLPDIEDKWIGQLYYNGYPWVYIDTPDWVNPFDPDAWYYTNSSGKNIPLRPDRKGRIYVDLDYLPNIKVDLKDADEDQEVSLIYGYHDTAESFLDKDDSVFSKNLDGWKISNFTIYFGGVISTEVRVITKGWNSFFPPAKLGDVPIDKVISTPVDFSSANLSGILGTQLYEITVTDGVTSSSYEFWDEDIYKIQAWNPVSGNTVTVYVEDEKWFEGIQS